MVVGLSVWAWFFIKGFRRQQKRRLLLSSPFSPAWDAILKKNLPPYTRLSPGLLQQLQDATRIFMAEKSFEGCGGLTLTDEMKVTIAAQACMLLLNRKAQYYPNLYSILVYPSTYVAGTRPTMKGQAQQASARLGESWHSGAVVLAWDSVKNGAANFNDGHYVLCTNSPTSWTSITVGPMVPRSLRAVPPIQPGPRFFQRSMSFSEEKQQKVGKML